MVHRDSHESSFDRSQRAGRRRDPIFTFKHDDPSINNLSDHEAANLVEIARILSTGEDSTLLSDALPTQSDPITMLHSDIHNYELGDAPTAVSNPVRAIDHANDRIAAIENEFGIIGMLDESDAERNERFKTLILRSLEQVFSRNEIFRRYAERMRAEYQELADRYDTLAATNFQLAGENKMLQSQIAKYEGDLTFFERSLKEREEQLRNMKSHVEGMEASLGHTRDELLRLTDNLAPANLMSDPDHGHPKVLIRQQEPRHPLRHPAE